MRKLNRSFLPKPLLLISILVLVGAAYLLGWSKIFVVEKVVVASQDKDVVKEVTMKLAQPPAVVQIGEPLARVDRREIASRLRELLWVDNVELNRNVNCYGWIMSSSIEISSPEKCRLKFCRAALSHD
ncbi:MAG: hypothetical protein RLZZ92_630 [Actinomycetota bacterium]